MREKAASIGKALLKIMAVLVGSVVLFVLAFGVFFFVTPEFRLSPGQVRWLAERYLPGSVALRYSDIDIRLIRPEGLPFAKYLSVESQDLCVRYEGEAARACFAEVSFGATAGWGGERPEGASRWKPGLISIDPIRLLAGDVRVNLPAFPESDPDEEPAEAPGDGLDVFNLVRNEILPKWNLEGSRIELDPLEIKTEDDRFSARFDLTTKDEGDTLRAVLHEFKADQSPLRAQAVIRLTQPAAWIQNGVRPTVEDVWRLRAEGDVTFAKDSSVAIEADSRVQTWDDLDFKVATKWRGITALKEIHLDGALEGDLLQTGVTLRAGALGAQVRALDFVNCQLEAQLELRVGSFNCGPQTVRMELVERERVREPGLYVVEPEFILRATRIEFDETRSMDFELDVNVDHFGFLSLNSEFKGQVRQAPNEDLRYALRGEASFAVKSFKRLVRLLRATPYAVPAPLNTLDGPIGLRVQADLDETGGGIDYLTSTELDSRHQAVHLRLDGRTTLRREADQLIPSTAVDLLVDQLRVSLPRFDLRAPPKLIPDGRFGPIEVAQDPEGADTAPPMDFRMRIRTTEPNSIRLATNLTGAPIPIELNVVYDDRKRPAPLQELEDPARSPASVVGGEVNVDASRTPQGQREAAQSQSAVTGWVRVGHTPIDIFRRNAAVEELRVDFLESGVQRLNGRVNINYLDYEIQVLLSGHADQPQIRMQSDPPLDDDQILSVLLFGRPLDDLDDEQRQSVSGMRSAFANAALGISSLYLLASTPIESIGYDPERDLVTARVGLGGGTTLEVGGGSDSSAVGLRKRLGREFVLRSDVERVGATGRRTVSALVEWVRRF